MLKRAEKIIPFSFPKDHGQHPDFQTEWWYLSGRLASTSGYNWAYHFTIFRRAFSSWSDLALIALAMASRSIREIPHFKKAFAGILKNPALKRIPVDGYVGHFSLTNVDHAEFVFFERGGTSLLSVSGADHSGLNVWVKSWKLFHENDAIRLVANRQDFGIDFKMTPQKSPILLGNNGLSPKALGAGESSYHYALPLLKTTGDISWKGISHEVTGTSLMDREFGTAILPSSIRGWDWFGIVLDAGYELIMSLIRKSDGETAETSSGTIVKPDGSCSHFGASDIDATTIESWESNETGAVYPVHWRIRIEKVALELEIEAVIKEHELVTATSTTINYWEGPVTTRGFLIGNKVSGHGHVELVGYSESAGGKF